MPTTYDDAIKPLSSLIGEPAELDLPTRVCGYAGTSPCQLFHWFKDDSTRNYISEDKFECYLEDYPGLFSDGEWQKPNLLPFAMIHDDLILFFDLEAGDGEKCPVKAWNHESSDRFEDLAADVGELKVRPRSGD